MGYRNRGSGRMSGGIQITWGEYAGFYFYRGDPTIFRICFGWVAISVQKYDTDAVLKKLMDMAKKHYSKEEIRNKMELKVE